MKTKIGQAIVRAARAAEAKAPKRCSMCDTDFPVKGSRWCAHCTKEFNLEFKRS